MNIDNPSIVLIAIFTQRNDQDITTFKQLQKILPLEKSHISQTLAHNEKKNLIRKPDNNTYFTTILITPQGIRKAQRYITFLQTLINAPNPPPINNIPVSKKEILPQKSSSPLDLKLFLDKFTSRFFPPLKNTLKNSLQDYIPKSHLSDNLIDDLTDTILDFFHDQFSTIYNSKN